MKKYCVEFTTNVEGHVYINADSRSEAEDKFKDLDLDYEDFETDKVKNKKVYRVYDVNKD